MSAPAETIRMNLMAKNPDYQRLSEAHARYAAQLDQIECKPYLTEQDKLEEIRLKKLKLRAKDLMEVLVQRAQTA